MANFVSLLRAFMTSAFDWREPVQLFLGELWDQALPGKDQMNLMVEALSEAIIDESGNNSPAWTRNDLERVVSIDLETYSLENLDSGVLGQALQHAFADVALLPSRVVDKYDFDQIARNVIARAFSKFESKLQQPENQRIRDRLLREYSRRTGIAVTELKNGLATLGNKVGNIEGRIETLDNRLSGVDQKMDEVDRILKGISEAKRTLRTTKTTKQRGAQSVKLTPDERKSLMRRLEDLGEAGRILAELRDRFVSLTDFPPQAQKDLLSIRRRVNEIRKQLGLVKI